MNADHAGCVSREAVDRLIASGNSLAILAFAFTDAANESSDSLARRALTGWQAATSALGYPPPVGTAAVPAPSAEEGR